MAQVKVDISINGWDESLEVHSLAMQQAYNRHHVFELVAFAPVGFELSTGTLKAIAGEQAHICISTGNSEDGACHFTGFVNEVAPIWTPRNTALRVKGFSPTIFMDCAPRFRTFTEKTLGQILDTLMRGYSGKQRPRLATNATGQQAPFSVQAQETDYRYLCRLADTYGKLFFYDGQQLHFGELNELSDDAISLDFRRESNNVELSLNLAPLSFQLSGFNLEKSETLQYNANQEFFNSHPLVSAAIEKSNGYPSQRIHLNHLVDSQPALWAVARRIVAHQAHELLTLKGTSHNPALKVGCRVSIEGTDEIMSNGSYFIIEVTHQVDNDNAYHNTFTAVPSGYPFPIRMQQARNPVCGPLMAIVKENNDPQNLGRVRVEFIGDEERNLSPWLRVLAPYTRYGGLFFLPEKEDQVMVFHEDFNAEKSPFVMGCFYHGKANAGKWEDTDNKKKGIALDKIQFLFDDHSGKLTIEAEEVEIKARKAMNLNGGRQLTQKAGRIDLNP